MPKTRARTVLSALRYLSSNWIARALLERVLQYWMQILPNTAENLLQSITFLVVDV
jgi:hypothetical protein